MIGKQILNYKIKERIGSGGMGDVYLAEHTSIGREVAIKVLRSEVINHEQVRKRFRNEAKVMAQLQHPNIVGLYDFHEDDKGLYLIMEYVKGTELDTEIKNLNAPMELDRAMKLWNQILEAFKYAHQNGIVHRDVKPSNIIIDAHSNVKVLDFGVAKIIGNEQFNLTKEGANVGTAYYMSPEQVRGKKIDQRTDIYSLGVTLYEMLAGFSPLKSFTTEYDIYNEIVRNPLKSIVDTMGEQYVDVWRVISKATEKDPANRFQSIEEMREAWKEKVVPPEPEMQAEKKVPETEIKTPAPASKPKGNNRLLLVLFGLLAAAVIVIISLMSLGDDSTHEYDDEIDTTTKKRKLYMTTVASSTYPKGTNLTFLSSNAIDGNLKTWWSPKTSRLDREWIQVNLGGTFEVSGVEIHGGSHYPNYSSGKKNYGNIYYQNYRLKRVRFEFSDGDYEVHVLQDLDRIQTVYFRKSHNTSYVQVVPLDLYETTRWKEICISEISVLRE